MEHSSGATSVLRQTAQKVSKTNLWPGSINFWYWWTSLGSKIEADLRCLIVQKPFSFKEPTFAGALDRNTAMN
jgi:hypothetical protein